MEIKKLTDFSFDADRTTGNKIKNYHEVRAVFDAFKAS